MQLKLIILLFCVVLFCCQPKKFWDPQPAPLIENEKIVLNKSFKIQDVEKNQPEIDLLIINFFAPDCKGCIDELPLLEKIYHATSATKNQKFITIGSLVGAVLDDGGEESFNDEDAITKILMFAANFKMKTQLYLARPKILASYGLTGFPETFILKRDQKGSFYLARHILGELTAETAALYIKL